MINGNTIPMSWHEKYTSAYEQDAICPCCGKALKPGAPRKYIHVVNGGASILAVDLDAETLGLGSMGWFAIGSSCARKIGPGWCKALPPI